MPPEGAVHVGKGVWRLTDGSLKFFGEPPKSAGREYGADTEDVGGMKMQWNPQTQRYDIPVGPVDGGGGGGGLTFDEQMTLKQTPSVSVSHSRQDPRALELQAQQIDQSWEQFLVGYQQQDRQFAANLAQDQAQLRFLHTKFDFEQRMGEGAAARDTVGLLNQIQGRQEQHQFQYAQLQQQANITNANFQMQAAQINEEYRQANIAAQQQTTRDIAGFTRQPGDVGAAAGMMRAGGGSAISTAVARGESAITPQSLAILDRMLGVQDTLRQGPQRVEAPQVAVPNAPQQQPMDLATLLAQLGQAGQTTPTTSQETWPLGVASPLGAFTPETAASGYEGMQANAAQGIGTVSDAGGSQWSLDPDAQQWVKMENGGILDGGAAIVGDSSDGKENRELVIGNAMVIPEDDLPKDLKKHLKGKKKLQKGGTVGNPLMRAQTFMEDAGRIAMSLGGFTNVPTPVQMATPGQSPWMQQLAAATTATTRGIPQELFFEEIQRVTPRGISDGVTRRTR